MVTPGQQDIDRAASALASRLPWPLGVLGRLAYNYRWAWSADGTAVFREVDPRRWRLCDANPVRLLQEASPESLLRAAANDDLIARAERVEQEIQADLDRPYRTGVISTEKPVAYFSAEYAVHRSLPIYSGGLGALAGDTVKEASDLALPFVAVGLMYRRGYFRQRIDVTGWQQEFWVPTDPERTPAVLITENGDGRTPVKIAVNVGEDTVHAQIWRVNVGRVPMLLLDTEIEENDRVTRWITSRLYDGDPGTRLAQYMLLGAGGMTALRTLGIDPGVVHMNEGHAVFAALETARAEVENGASFDEAIERARKRTVFTTHTPVPAGNDTYPADQLSACVAKLAEASGTSGENIVALGRTHADNPDEPFGVTQLALRTARSANGVAKRHGEVAREMWQGLWPEKPVDEVPITHVTNGVHVPSWVGLSMRRLLCRHLGDDWLTRAGDPETFAKIDAIPAEELWAVRNEQRAQLVDFVRERSTLERVARGEQRSFANAAAEAFDKDALTIGFARRLATYKRLHLLMHDVQRALGVLGSDRPIQLLLAGKAHPRDDGGKHVVQGLFGLRGEQAVAQRVVFIEDYDLGVAARLVRGCDVWVNVPRPPLEASGTSGMKSAVNGGLQLSVLDGWWVEGYTGDNGWAISGDVDADHGAQDGRDAAELYRLIEEEVVPEFHDRDAGGIPQAWVERVKRSMKTNIPQFSATRMVVDYEQKIYRT